MLCGLFIMCDTGLQYFYKFCSQKETYMITFSTFVEQHSYIVMGDYITQTRYVDIK